MPQFSILPAAFKDLQRRLVPMILFLFAMIVFMLIILPWILSGEIPTVDSSTMIMFLIFIPLLGFAYFNALKKQKAMLASYKLTITDDSISREMMNMPVLVIHRKDVRKIIKRADGTITILGDSRLNDIGISAHIERKEELEVILNSIIPITVKTSTPWYQRYLFFILVVTLTLMFSALYLENKFLSSAAGVFFVGMMISSFIAIQKSKNVDTRTKRLSYIMFIPLLSVIGSLISKWMA